MPERNTNQGAVSPASSRHFFPIVPWIFLSRFFNIFNEVRAFEF
jgi:hypothetical protein